MPDPLTDIAIDLIRLNQNINFYLILILSFVGWITLVKVIISSVFTKTRATVNYLKQNLMLLIKVKEATILEVIWTIVPAIILVYLLYHFYSIIPSEEKHADMKACQ